MNGVQSFQASPEAHTLRPAELSAPKHNSARSAGGETVSVKTFHLSLCLQMNVTRGT
jgi:hypothetical protein